VIGMELSLEVATKQIDKTAKVSKVDLSVCTCEYEGIYLDPPAKSFP
jgi:hypothetical protein